MAEARFDFAAVDAIDAESIGEPGKRTFRVRILRGDESASLWVEKQQLSALGEAIPRLIEQLDSEDQHPDVDSRPINYFPDDPTVEFKVGRLALGYAAQEDRLVLVAHDLGPDPDEEDDMGIGADQEADYDPEIPAFSCRFTREQARFLSNSCADAVAGGRPACVLCHRPINTDGHMCPRANGHQKLPQTEGEAE
jgi:uncharacterized repeat protein (TIGR03847 family)